MEIFLEIKSLFLDSFLKYKCWKGVESLQQTLIFWSFIFPNQCRRPQIFQTINSVKSNNLSWNIKSLYSISLCIFQLPICNFCSKSEWYIRNINIYIVLKPQGPYLPANLKGNGLLISSQPTVNKKITCLIYNGTRLINKDIRVNT